MWLALAIAASMLWGVTYAINGHLLKTLSVPTLLFFSSTVAAAVMLATSLATKRFSTDVQAVFATRGTLPLLAAFIVTALLANVAISYSIAGRNATLAAVVEIAYPLFTVLAAWLLFGERHLNASTLVGGLLIFAGAAVISLRSA